ncbi:hypothetical protein DFJ73DRAFT_764493 [Zopfochytrium polystomum]|nr:hypothetical protein DFJ73DRAFT_764493 [Zopfochytrium polystomum]
MHLSLPSLSVLVMLAVACVVQAKPIPTGNAQDAEAPAPWDEHDDKTADRGRNREHHPVEENVQKHKDRDGRVMARFDENSSHAQHKKKAQELKKKVNELAKHT